MLYAEYWVQCSLAWILNIIIVYAFTGGYKMTTERANIIEDKDYRPSSPERAERHFFIEAGAYRWEIYVWQHVIKETGTPLYRALADEGHTCYGLTVNEALNDLAAIMTQKITACKEKNRIVSLESVRSFLDPHDAAKEDIKIARLQSGRSLLSKILGL